MAREICLASGRGNIYVKRSSPDCIEILRERSRFEDCALSTNTFTGLGQSQKVVPSTDSTPLFPEFAKNLEISLDARKRNLGHAVRICLDLVFLKI